MGTLVDNEMENPPLLPLAGGGGSVRPPQKVGRMTDDDSSDDQTQSQDDLVILSAEESALAELLGELKHGDWARILFRLSTTAKDEIRSAIGRLQGEASYGQDKK